LEQTREFRAHVKSDLPQRLEAWPISAQSQSLIDAYKIGAEKLFLFHAIGG